MRCSTCNHYRSDHRRKRSSIQRPGHHQSELVAPEPVAVRTDALSANDVGARVAQRVRPPDRVVAEERFPRAGDEVGAGEASWQHDGWLVARSRRGAEDRAVDVWMPQPEGE